MGLTVKAVVEVFEIEVCARVFILRELEQDDGVRL